MASPERTLGILNPHSGFARFSLERREPCPALAPFVQNYWSTRWDLRGEPAFEQEILPHPCVNIGFEAERSRVHGPAAGRFLARLSGFGWVFGVKFKPAGFLPFARVRLSALVDRVAPLAETLGRDEARVKSLIAAVRRDDDDSRIIPLVESFLLESEPRIAPDFALVERLVTLAREDRTIGRAEQLAGLASLSLRSLHRLFERHVGVGPKWIIVRSRVQEAAERVARGNKVDWAALAQELGYHDQSHLVRDFKNQIGFTPAAYAARCEAACSTKAPR